MVGNYLNSHDKSMHSIASFFESQRLPLRMVDPQALLHCDTPDQREFSEDLVFLRDHDIKDCPTPLIFIHNTLVEQSKFVDLAKKGTLYSILNFLRCLKCFKKLPRRPQEIA